MTIYINLAIKYTFGTIFTLLILNLCLYFILGLWGMTFFSKEILYKILITLGISLIGFMFLLILGSFFFKNHSKGYENPENNIAAKKKK